MAAAAAAFADALDDLAIRFVVNVPEDELRSFERICFQIEQAHWFYEDFFREQNPSLPRLSLRDFASAMFEHVPLLRRYAGHVDTIFQKFLDYKFKVPVCGAAILSPGMDKCLLVKGWSSGAGWSFPRGKINQGEDMDKCAIREVKEEVGYDITPLLKQDAYLEHTEHGHTIRLYVVCNVPEDTPFQTQTRKEISKIAWFDISQLPKSRDADGSGKFYSVAPFVGKLRRWIREHSAPAKDKARRDGPTPSASSTALAPGTPAAPGRGRSAPPPAAAAAVTAAAKKAVDPFTLSMPVFPNTVDIGRSLLDFKLDRAALAAALKAA